MSEKKPVSMGLIAGALAAAFAVTLAVTRPTNAITGGHKAADDTYPHVVMIIFDVDGVRSHRCSGTLLSPTVVLTAGHCTTGTSGARVYTGVEMTDPLFPDGGGVSGSTHTHPGYDDFATFPNTSDLGVVVLDDDILVGAYGELPELGLLDALGKHTRVDLAGYGLQSTVPHVQEDLVRFETSTHIINLKSANNGGFNIQTKEDAGRGNQTGGSCFGDSGGPIFLDGTNVVVAVVSFGLSPINCVGTGFNYRTDIENAQDFIQPFLAGGGGAE
jgi:secreted trypsin-like serine protease